ncbi:unnamed protein product [Adineta ricciae]|uniref:RNA-dependent RNA polymerase n=1 Tax=Adineta ricciae TaxID=249248 RepID=A0A814X9Q2_ADIRI|nr:unnamed protein product [Adineta ricciae]
MTERSIHCTFHHVSPDLVRIISSSLSIQSLSKSKDNQYTYTCSLSSARHIRSILADSLGEYPQIWFSIDHTNRSTSNLFKTSQSVDQLYFGSLLSTEKFLIHSTPLDRRTPWTIRIDPKQTLVLQSSDEQLSIPMKFLQKDVLVIDSEDFSEMIFSYNSISIDRPAKLYGNHPLIRSLNQCSDFLICLSPKSQVDAFLDNLQLNYHFRIFYTTLTVQVNISQWSMHYFDDYRTDYSRYALSMLHSLGYVFDDKYLNSKTLQNQMKQLAEKDEQQFYQIALKVYYELKKCHWLDLTKLFQQTSVKISSNDDKALYVSVVHLTPTRLLIMPKEKSKGHRIIRHPHFQGIDEFCLVYIKPDPPNIYLNDNYQLIEYFQDLFEQGIDLNGVKYHLFGSSNSQLKEHSFWFIKASSLDEIHRKRQVLGQLDQIRNLGTYVARLGLWFSKTDPTNIQLTYCSNESEFHRRIRQREVCVMMIEDIERNNYCFTDGCGLVSKGLAKLISERQEKLDCVPSAYQIRMAGCKGLIIIDPQSTYEQFHIKIRPSMKKFECDHWFLDICGHSRATPSRLNNQFIWLLSDLGVPDKTFFQLQQRWFSKKPSSSNYSDDLLKNKIPLPVNECRYIYGCALESQLQEGQCFLRYEVLNNYGKSFTNRKFECVRGRIIVTKNPCPYAGDMLELWAVDLPELYHLNDVIVFSVRGERPDFNKIAGSDLDGDGYFVYWGEELRLNHQVSPLDYTPDEKQYQSSPICPNDVIRYCLSTLNATNSGEIYNLHAVIVDKNYENCARRTCQPLAIELARMFSSSVDSGKTGYVVDKKRIQQLRATYAKKYPDFLGKDKKRSYESTSIVGKLYQNALKYINGKTNELENIFAQLNLNKTQDEVKITTDQPARTSSKTSAHLHPGSPLSPIQNFDLTTNDDSNLSINEIPPQFILIDGMASSSSPIRLSSSPKPFYVEHGDLVRFRIELPLFSSSPSLSSLFINQLSSLQPTINPNQFSTFVISFGYIYLLKYPEQRFASSDYPKTLDCLLNQHFLPSLSTTFLPSTILERIEITEDNSHCLQQVFYKPNHRIKREFIELISDSLYLIFPWFKMKFIEHQREIILICFNLDSQQEIFVHFDKSGRIKSIEILPKLFFKCFHQQTSSHRLDILYEFRSYSTIPPQNYSSIFKHQTLLDPTQPLTLPFEKGIIPIISYSRINNSFQSDNIQVHIQRIYSPIHYKNDDFYKLRCVLGYLEQEQQRSIELRVEMSRKEDFNRDKLRYIMSLAVELSQMLE